MKRVPVGSTFDLVLRGWAASLGLFALVNLVVAALDGGVDPNLWWIDLRWAPAWLALGIVLLAGIALVLTGLRPRQTTRWFTRPVFGLLFVLSFADGMAVLAVYFDGYARGGGLPLSFGVALFFFVLVESVSRLARRPPAVRLTVWTGVGAGMLSFGLAFPLLLVWTFGSTVYVGDLEPLNPDRATAVVLGAGVRSDGTPSQALADRTHTAIDLYKDGVVDRLFFSGGPGPGGQHEATAMAALAAAEGVPMSAVALDLAGLSTEATARHGAARCASAPIYAVSHAYHLPRVELAFWRYGVDVRTVPAKQTRPLARRFRYLLREVPGFWFYWARRVAGVI